MKKNLFFILLCAATLVFAQKKQSVVDIVKPELISPEGKIRCATNEKYELAALQGKKVETPEEFENWLKPLIEEYKRNNLLKSESGGIITIPVVVHILHDNKPVGVAPNITDEQVASQILVLNQDYRKMAGTRGANTNAVGADVTIQFELAKVDPNGNPTNGIDRVVVCQSILEDAQVDLIKPGTIWDPTKYLNMWTANLAADLLGYATFPSSTLAGLSASDIGAPGNATNDGVVSGYNYFGSRDISTSFLLDTTFGYGRTMTHEVGHFLGLRHIWGDDTNASVCATDYCNDTPPAHQSNFGCSTNIASCTSGLLEMVQNYMDYSNDICMNIFTNDQKTRILTVMNNSPRRNELRASTTNVAIALFANDAEVKLPNVCSANSCATSQSRKIYLYNRGTANLTAATIQYNINGGTNYSYTFSGNIAPNKYADINMPISAVGNGTLNVTVLTANGVTDQRASNNTASVAFSSLPDTYNTTSVVFTLQRDFFGSETNWNLKNGAGTILYSGSGYTDSPSAVLPALLTQNWTLSLNDCYTFTINDTYGDGICCGGGNGYFNIKTSTGTLMTQGSDFGNFASYSFKLQTLGVGDIENQEIITSVYPNPNKGTFFVKTEAPAGKVNANVYDASGKLIYTEVIHHIGGELTKEMSVQAPAGSYILVLETENGTSTTKFMIKQYTK